MRESSQFSLGRRNLIWTYLNFSDWAAGSQKAKRKRDIRLTFILAQSEDLPSVRVIKIIPGSFTFLKGF